MSKEDFKETVERGLAQGKYFLCVRIETEGMERAEVITNPRENIVAKLNYYLKAYNDNMELISAKEKGKDIRITDVLMTSNLNDLNWFCY